MFCLLVHECRESLIYWNLKSENNATLLLTKFYALLLDKFESCNVLTANLQFPSALFLSLMKRVIDYIAIINLSGNLSNLVDWSCMHNAQTIAPFALEL